MRCLTTDDPLLQDRKSRYILQCHRQTIQCHHWLAAGNLCAKTYTSEAVAERRISSLVSGCSMVDINTRIVWYSLAAVLVLRYASKASPAFWFVSGLAGATGGKQQKMTYHCIFHL